MNPSQTIHAVLCYIERPSDGKYLLLLKAKGKFGEGFWNAPGGKIEPSESAEKAAVREVFEETGLVVSDLKVAGNLEFYFGPGKAKPDWTAVVFKTSNFSGSLRERSEEGTLEWFGRDRLPMDKMWEDDRYWLPLLLRGVGFAGRFEFTADSKKLVKHELRILTEDPTTFERR